MHRKMVLDADGSPTFHGQEGQPLPRRPSVRSMHSTQSRMSGTRLQRAKSGISTFSLEGNDMSPSASYTINGFNQKEERFFSWDFGCNFCACELDLSVIVYNSVVGKCNRFAGFWTYCKLYRLCSWVFFWHVQSERL